MPKKVVVVTCPEFISQEQFDRLKSEVREALGNVKLVLLDGGMKIETMTVPDDVEKSDA